MSKIVRTKSRAEGGITDAEKRLMDEHAKLWISRALRTEPIDASKIVPAIEGLYEVAGLKKPRVVVVPSPLVMAFSFGASAAILYNKNSPTRTTARTPTRTATRNATINATYNATANATINATDDATRNATRNATINATDYATRTATANATDNATRTPTNNATANATADATDYATINATDYATRTATANATDNATRTPTDDATANATNDATRTATYNATDDVTNNVTAGAIAACRELAGEFGLQCAARWRRVYQGGNMWAGYDAYLTACRDILGLDLASHAAYKFWETAAIEGGFRVMHEEFCIVSDFPEFIKTDNENLPHCEDGPSHRWRDGWSLYHWHGHPIPSEWIEDRSSLTPEKALTWPNIDQRTAACEILGWHKIIDANSEYKLIDKEDDPERGSLVSINLPEHGDQKFLRVKCGTGRDFALMVPNFNDEGSEIKTVFQAQAALAGLPEQLFNYPTIRT